MNQRAIEILSLHDQLTQEMGADLTRALAKASGLDLDHYDTRDKQIIGLLVHWDMAADLSQETVDELWRKASAPPMDLGDINEMDAKHPGWKPD